MKKWMKKRWMSAMLVLSMIIPMFSNLTGLNVYAQDKVVDTFYILDEEGNPVTIEITQSDLDSYEKESSPYNLAKTGDNGESATEDIIGIVRFHRDVAYFNYKEVDTGRTGYLSPMTTADAAYLGTQEDGILCYVAGTKILVDSEDVAQIVSYEDQTFCQYYVGDQYLIHRYTYFDGGDTVKQSTIRLGVAPSYLEKVDKDNQTKYYYSYDGHYFYETFEEMIEDYKNDVRDQSVNPDDPYYNYYQYVSFHTETVYEGKEYDDYVIEKKGKDSGSKLIGAGDAFKSSEAQYTINSILMVGIAINESGWGMSTIAKDKNNLFGLNAVDNDPYNEANEFSSVEDCIREFAYYHIHMEYLNGSDSRYFGPHLGDKQSGINVKYASDPYWGEKAAARPYYFDEDNRDYGRYSIGIAKKGSINLYKEPDTSSKVIYTSETKSGGDVFDYPVTIIDKVTNSDGVAFYQVVSDMSLLEDRSGRDVEAWFEPSRDYVYAKASDIDVVFEGSGEGTDIGNNNTEVELPFTDVKTTDWFYDYVEWAYEENVSVGYVESDGTSTFRPENICNRAEIVTFLYNLLDGREPEDTVKNPFTDVDSKEWYYDFIMWAVENEYASGYKEEDGTYTFRPLKECSRAEIITFIYNVKGGKPVDSVKNPFKDIDSDAWYYDFVMWGYDNGIVSGYLEEDGTYTFRPENTCTRAEVVTMLYGAFGQ